MVTMISQNLSEFDLHLRAVMGWPIPEIIYYGPSASTVILADRDSENFHFSGVEKALKSKNVDLRLFGKPSTRAYRRMGVALAKGKNTQVARSLAHKTAKAIKINHP
jgi:phosphoribosylglycinamide formyltransferase 2